MGEPDQRIIDEASDHPYECRCEKCEVWWASMPPEEDGPDDDEDWLDMTCSLGPDGQCGQAGSEFCDFECRRFER